MPATPLIVVAFVGVGARAAPPESSIQPQASSGSSTSAPSVSSTAPAAETAATAASPAVTPWSGDPGDTRAGLDPFPSTGQYLSFGVGFTSEALLAAGPLCPEGAAERCVLGGGGGILMSGAFRTPSYSLGAVYEVSFHDSHNIYQRGVLQQLRGEWRLRPRAAQIIDSVSGFVGAGAGIAGYGDDWGVSTFGGSGHGTIGAEIDLGVKLTLVLSLTYRGIYFKAFEDASRQYRPAGFVHLLGMQLGFELHDPL